MMEEEKVEESGRLWNPGSLGGTGNTGEHMVGANCIAFSPGIRSHRIKEDNCWVLCAFFDKNSNPRWQPRCGRSDRCKVAASGRVEQCDQHSIQECDRRHIMGGRS